MKSKKLKVFLVISLLLNFVGLVLGTILFDRAIFWRSEREYLKERSSEKHGNMIYSNRIDIKRVVFLGDSRTEMFPLRAFFPNNLYCLNKGISGDKMAEISNRYFNDIRPDDHDILIIQGGINDILDGVNGKEDQDGITQRIINEYNRIVSKELSTNKPPVVMSILPVTNRFLLPFSMYIRLPTNFDVTETNKVVVNTNNELKKLCSEKMIKYVDVHSKVINKEGKFSRRYTKPDGKHVNLFGYEVIAQEIQPVLIN
jgi:lysophospholipase L1-like esterase